MNVPSGGDLVHRLLFRRFLPSSSSTSTVNCKRRIKLILQMSPATEDCLSKGCPRNLLLQTRAFWQPAKELSRSDAWYWAFVPQITDPRGVSLSAISPSISTASGDLMRPFEWANVEILFEMSPKDWNHEGMVTKTGTEGMAWR